MSSHQAESIPHILFRRLLVYGDIRTDGGRGWVIALLAFRFKLGLIDVLEVGRHFDQIDLAGRCAALFVQGLLQSPEDPVRTRTLVGDQRIWIRQETDRRRQHLRPITVIPWIKRVDEVAISSDTMLGKAEQ